MQHNKSGNLLMVSNYPSETAYAWWLMEHFWKIQAQRVVENKGKAFLAYPAINSISETIANAPIEITQLNLPWKNKQQQKQAMEFIRENNIKYLYFTDQPYFHLQYADMRKAGVKTIVVHDHTPGDRPAVKGIKRIIKDMRNALPKYTADYVFCVSELMRTRNLENARVPPEKCKVIQNGINPVRCKTSNRHLIRNNLSLSEEELIVITTGRAHPYKRFDFVINCARQLFTKYPQADITFLLVGDGPAMADLQIQVKQLGLESRVILLGFRKDIQDLLCASDIALHAALGEGFSLSILEYMSASLPVLVPDIPSVSQAIIHQHSGLIYPTTDSHQVADFIYELTENKEKRLEMGRAAKKQVDTIYTLDNCSETLINAINVAYDLQ